MSAAPTIAILAAFTGQSYTVPFSGHVAFVHVEDAADRFISAVSQDYDGAAIFDMQGTEADVADVIAEIGQQIQGADISITGNALPFPHAPDDGRLDSFTGLAPYRSMRDGIAHTLEVFETARLRNVLTLDTAKQLIEKNA
jgi:nucleoside-diphosphate-sugar epimerase